MKNPIDFKQGSAEWLQARCGSCTGSRVKDALSFNLNGEPSAARRKYAVDLICERLTGQSAMHFVTEAMSWGTEMEKLARAAYEDRTGQEVDLIGIALHPAIKDFGASPDGLIGKDGVVEFKCPMTATHVAWMIEGVVPDEHVLQLYAEMACTGRKWVDFVSFDPRLPQRYQLFIKRLEFASPPVAAMEVSVQRFLDDTAELMDRMNELNPPLADEASDPNPYGELGILESDIPNRGLEEVSA